MRRTKKTTGMTLVEMLAAMTVLMILTAILAEVFYQASKAASTGKALAEAHQVSRALRNVLAKDLSGATPDFFESQENGYLSADVNWAIAGLPPGPYCGPLAGGPFTVPEMRRMLMGGSDFLVLTSSGAAGADKSVAKVYYVLRETGQLIRISHNDTIFSSMDYALDAYDHGVDILRAADMDLYEEKRIIAQNVQRVKFSMLDKRDGPVSSLAYGYADPRYVDNWSWSEKRYLPVAVKVELQIADHLWNTADDDRFTSKNFDPLVTDDGLRASEMFDPDDGEVFTFVIDLPLAMRASGG